MNVLITGISGRIGAGVARRLVASGHKVRGLVWPQDRSLKRLGDLPIDLVEGSLSEPEVLHRAVNGMEIICHLGAAFQAGGPFSHEDFFETNARGTFNLLEAALHNAPGLRRFIYASSDALYDKYVPGGMDAPIQVDSVTLAPRGAYALTKHLGEELCWGYQRSFGLPITVLRFAMTMDADEILDFAQFRLRHWLDAYAAKVESSDDPITDQVYDQLLALNNHEETLLVVRDEQGRAYKKHIAHVHDISHGVECAAQEEAATGQAYQLAAPSAFTWDKAVPYLAQQLNLPFAEVQLLNNVPTFYEFDLNKSREDLGFSPQYDINAMIDAGIEYRKGQAC